MDKNNEMDKIKRLLDISTLLMDKVKETDKIYSDNKEAFEKYAKVRTEIKALRIEAEDIMGDRHDTRDSKVPAMNSNGLGVTSRAYDIGDDLSALEIAVDVREFKNEADIKQAVKNAMQKFTELSGLDSGEEYDDIKAGIYKGIKERWLGYIKSLT